MELNRKLQQDISYVIRMEPGVQTPEETLVNASGSCRDTGWLLVQVLRAIGAYVGVVLGAIATSAGLLFWRFRRAGWL